MPEKLSTGKETKKVNTDQNYQEKLTFEMEHRNTIIIRTREKITWRIGIYSTKKAINCEKWKKKPENCEGNYNFASGL
jgi:hypothetical protein